MDLSAGLTIRAIRARGLNLRLDRPIETASGVMRTTPLVLLDLSTQQGIIGRSYVRCSTSEVLQPMGLSVRF
jgi:mandelate racemase